MAISERTYTFRAPADLGHRIVEMGNILNSLGVNRDAHVADRLGREVAMRYARRVGEGRPLSGENQSAFLRDVVELFVESSRKIAADLEWDKVYAAERAAETDDDRRRHDELERLAMEAWDSE